MNSEAFCVALARLCRSSSRPPTPAAGCVRCNAVHIGCVATNPRRLATEVQAQGRVPEWAPDEFAAKVPTSRRHNTAASMLSGVASGYTALQRSAFRCYLWSALRCGCAAGERVSAKEGVPCCTRCDGTQARAEDSKGSATELRTEPTSKHRTAKHSTAKHRTAKHRTSTHRHRRRDRAERWSKQQALAVLWYQRPY